MTHIHTYLILLLVANFAAQFSSFCTLAYLATQQNKRLDQWFAHFAKMQETALPPLPCASVSTDEAAPIPDVLPTSAPDSEKQPRPKEELAAELEEHWKSNLPDVRANPIGKKLVPDAPTSPKYRTTKRGAQEKPEGAVSYYEKKWKVGNKAIARKEVAAPAFEEEECLRVGAVVQVHSINKMSAVVFDPTNPLRGIAEADRGIGGWVVAFRNLELIPE